MILLADMNDNMFKEHHPHTLSDYVSRSMVDVSRNTVKLVTKSNYALRSIVANTILSSLSMVLANSLHHKVVFRGDGDRDAIEDLLCEASSTHFQVLVSRDLVQPKKSLLVCLYIFRGLAIFAYRLLSYLSPKAGHRTLGYIYEKSIADYSSWIEKIEAGENKNIEASKIAIGYYELKDDAMLTDVLRAMREDNIKYRDDEHGFADKRLK